MDVKLINPFIDATFNVLETMASTKATAGKPYLKRDKTAQGDVTGIIGLTGETRGTISISFTKNSILPIVSKMFGEEMKELNDEIKDAVGEIANMISGQARQGLEEMGRSLKAAIPTVIMGPNHTITHVTNYPIIAIPFTTGNGAFTIEVCFEE
ncbi:MAG: chemotaxis protein CheX [Deltaproteobacteria bacterium]|nr:chemotaxis protein CheX [Deltaproteobacteria bacterium]MCD6139324.1 chemotaxis protein CheX [Deltaproteobacteria bacterium]RLB89645.1 MAG: chemotaxis protein CheX [Deltaproteobacteria bacterium]RLB96515.1 MAG: chemotaxis protein CheX [Deltaproteobacteria bacterium]